MTVTVHQAKTTLAELLARVGAGEEVLIADTGKPVARLVPAIEKSTPRAPGTAVGLLKIAADFDDPLPHDIPNSFERVE